MHVYEAVVSACVVVYEGDVLQCERVYACVPQIYWDVRVCVMYSTGVYRYALRMLYEGVCGCTREFCQHVLQGIREYARVHGMH